jgi:hypothetical protein
MQMARRLCRLVSRPIVGPTVVSWKPFICAWGGTTSASPSRGDDAALTTRGTAAIGPLNEETCAEEEDC